jgi:preprotein translocase subunit SecA
MRIFAADWVRKIMDRLGMEEDVPIESRMVSKSIERAQKQVEGRNFEMRKHLLEYDDVMNKQREAVYQLREQILGENEGRAYILRAEEGIITMLLDQYCPKDADPEDWRVGSLETEFGRYFGFDLAELGIDWETINLPQLEERLIEATRERYNRRVEIFGEETFSKVECRLLLDAVDRQWKDHLLALDHLREGIGLRAYGQRNPLVEYKRESFNLFHGMWDSIEDHVIKTLFHIQAVDQVGQRRQAAQTTMSRPDDWGLDASHAVQEQAASTPVGQPDRPATVRRAQPKVGRNEPCPCGSGKKFKRCCGAAQAGSGS